MLSVEVFMYDGVYGLELAKGVAEIEMGRC